MKKSQLKEAIKNEIKSVLSEDMNPKIYELRSRRVKATIDDLNQYLQNNLTASGLKSTLQDTIKFLDQFIFDGSLNEISSTEANAQLMEMVEHQKQILNILKELKKGDAVFAIKGADLNAAIKLITNEVGKTLTKVKNLKQIKGLQTTFADIREGTWSSGTYNEIGRFIQDVKNLKDKYYNIVGNDDVFDGLDRAEESAREMMINAPENRSDLNEDEMSDEEKDKAASKGAKKKDSVATISNKLQKLTAKMKKKAKEFKEAEGKAKDKIKDELKAMTSEKKELEKNL
tara:strand:+ start:1257 stop:2117 length:861 start_codon:yes stop_codon:yes gene_type:complete